jgi:hypothetical protein
MLGWLFRKRGPIETRSSGSGYTAQVAAARNSYITGKSGVAELTATAQSCISLWEGAFTIADVQGADMLDRLTMAMIGRSCALNGDAVFHIGPRGLVAATDWDISTRDGRPRAYRLNIPEAGGGRSVTALAAEVLHVRIGADVNSPWIGSSPLRRSSITGALLHAVESALAETFQNAPIGSQLVPLPDSSSEDMAAMRAGFLGRRGSTLVIEGVAQAVGAGMHPQIGQHPEQLTPDLQRAMTAETLGAARDGIMMAYGIPPSLANPSATGPAVREAQRHLALWTLQPVAELLQEEARAKLGADVRIDVTRPLQAFDTAGRARALQAIVTTMIEAKVAGLTDQQMTEAKRLVDWN